MGSLPFSHIRMVAGGRAGTADSWSVGLTAAAPDVPEPSQLNAFADAAWPAWNQWWNGGSPSVNSIAPSDFFLDSLRVYFYPSGAASATVVGEHIPASGINGGADHTQPNEECLVVTLTSGRAGRHGRGRMYVPAGGGALVQHQRTSDDCEAVATATKNLIEALNGVDVSGWSQGLVVIGSAALPIYPCTGVKVDSIPDVQRRRQFKMVPVAVVSHPITISP